MGTLRAFIRRDAQIAWSYRLPLLFDVMVALFTVVTYSFLARIVAPGRVPGGYFEFVLVGLILAAFLQAGVRVLVETLREQQTQGSLEVMFSFRIPTPLLAASIAAYPTLRATGRALLYVVIAAALGARAPEANWPLAAAATILGSVSFVGLGLFGVSLILLVGRGVAVGGWFVSLLTLSAGVLFPQELLPGWAVAAADASPFTHAVQIARGAVLEGASWSAQAGPLAILGGLALAYALAGVGVFGGSLWLARRTGRLGQH